ncbi:hypothetical protein F5146DRAFT_985758 [Armillaria mellea]|nr:hypothetical protein F5146DRAFT_985758 [Armillaria mellea]
MSAYGFEANFDDLLTLPETPSTDAPTPVSSYPSSPASSPSTLSDEPHIPRPWNCFMIFRSEYVALHKDTLEGKQNTGSQLAGAVWKQLPEERKDHYRALADHRKREHALAHPGYKYKPRRLRRGKKSNGRKKTKAPVASVSMDEQSFHHPPPNSIAVAPEVSPPLDPISSSVDSMHRPSTTTVNGISPVFDVNQAMYLMQSLSHPAASPFGSPSFPQINAFSPYPTAMMNGNDAFNQFLMTPDHDPSFLDLFGVYPDSSWESASNGLNLPEPTVDESVGFALLLPAPRIILTSSIYDQKRWCTFHQLY